MPVSAAAPVRESVEAVIDRVTELTIKPSGSLQIGIIGGKGSGKTYLFHALVARTTVGRDAGALANYLDGNTQVNASDRHDSEGTSLHPADLSEDYRKWFELDQTLEAHKKWYTLRLRYRTGFVGMAERRLDVRFLDGPGEIYQQNLQPFWETAFLQARVMIFCLPLWVAFPADALTHHSEEERASLLRNFHRTVNNYRQLRDDAVARQVSPPKRVRAVLALTAADDMDTSLTELRSQWILPYMEFGRAAAHLRKLRSSEGAVMRYLVNAQRISRYLEQKFQESRDQDVRRIPADLRFDGGDPFLAPLSSVSGAKLQRVKELEADNPSLVQKNSLDRIALSKDPPVPVHVELPLLVVLCEATNALM
jgi:hypothetical protein